MAPTGKQPQPEKLSRLPDNAKVHKRPLFRGPIASPYAGKKSAKIVYLSSKTPFMSAFKRVKQLLKHVEKRETERELLNAKKNQKRGGRAASSQDQRRDETEPVFVKATGKAIDKALQLALFLQQQQDLRVNIKIGSVDAIDDIVTEPKPEPTAGPLAQDPMELDRSTAEADGDTEELPEARIRHASSVEIEVTLR